MKRISSGSTFESSIGYSRAVIDGDFVHISGTTGYDYTSMTIASDPVAQAEQCCRNIEQVLETAGTDFNHIVRVRYIFADRDDFKPCWPVFQKYIGASPPAATMIVAGLYDDAMKLEVEVTARLSESDV